MAVPIIDAWSDYDVDRCVLIDDNDVHLPAIVREHNRDFARGNVHAHGAEWKEWVKAVYDGEPWLAKAGNIQLGPIALCIHEALISEMYRAAGLRANKVALGVRHLNVAAAHPHNPLLVSFHQYHEGSERLTLGPFPPFSATYWEDFATMRTLDLVVGQNDRHLQNYMMLRDGDLFVIDCGRCLTEQSIALPLADAELERLRMSGHPEQHPWTPSEMTAVRTRLQMLDDHAVDALFDAIPRVWRRLHDEAVARAIIPPFQTATLHVKKAAVKRNLGICRSWLARI